MIEEIENGLGLVVDASTPEIQIGLIEKSRLAINPQKRKPSIGRHL